MVLCRHAWAINSEGLLAWWVPLFLVTMVVDRDAASTACQPEQTASAPSKAQTTPHDQHWLNDMKTKAASCIDNALSEALCCPLAWWHCWSWVGDPTHDCSRYHNWSFDSTHTTAAERPARLVTCMHNLRRVANNQLPELTTSYKTRQD